MTGDSIKKAVSIFDKIRRVDENENEYWYARDLAKVLEYSNYRKNFLGVIEKARIACKGSGYEPFNHMVEADRMIKTGKGASRKEKDIKLSRYACYLAVQNADPKKEIVAMGQTYFAVQTRIQEIQQMEEYNNLSTEDSKRLFLRNELKKHNIKLAESAKDAGVKTSLDYAIFQNHGYKGLYGGLNAKGIHTKKGLKKSQKILDHMGSTELAANLFRATQTEEKLRREEIKKKDRANKAHFEVGKKVRKTIEELGGTMPENLPSPGSVKKLQRKTDKPQISETGNKDEK